MKSVLFTIALVLGTSAFAQEIQSRELCGVPVLPYGCDVDVCTVELQTNYGVIPVRTDSQGELQMSDLVKMAKAGGEQCFTGYDLAHGFTITGLAN